MFSEKIWSLLLLVKKLLLDIAKCLDIFTKTKVPLWENKRETNRVDDRVGRKTKKQRKKREECTLWSQGLRRNRQIASSREPGKIRKRTLYRLCVQERDRWNEKTRLAVKETGLYLTNATIYFNYSIIRCESPGLWDVNCRTQYLLFFSRISDSRTSCSFLYIFFSPNTFLLYLFLVMETGVCVKYLNSVAYHRFIRVEKSV